MKKEDICKIVESAGGIVKNYKKQIILVKTDNNKFWWGFPKGKIEKNESALITAKREIFEETGIKNIQLIKKLNQYERTAASGDPVIIKINMFLFETNQIDISPIDKKIIQVVWVNKEDVVNKLTLSADKDYFKVIQNEI